MQKKMIAGKETLWRRPDPRQGADRKLHAHSEAAAYQLTDSEAAADPSKQTDPEAAADPPDLEANAERAGRRLPDGPAVASESA